MWAQRPFSGSIQILQRPFRPCFLPRRRTAPSNSSITPNVEAVTNTASHGNEFQALPGLAGCFLLMNAPDQESLCRKTLRRRGRHRRSSWTKCGRRSVADEVWSTYFVDSSGMVTMASNSQILRKPKRVNRREKQTPRKYRKDRISNALGQALGKGNYSFAICTSPSVTDSYFLPSLGEYLPFSKSHMPMSPVVLIRIPL